MEEVNGKNVLAVPFPAQGHVKPLMKLCHKIAKHGIKVTFVNLESINQKITAAGKTSDEDEDEDEDEDGVDNIELVTLPDDDDGETRGHDAIDVLKMAVKLRATMPESLKGLIERINKASTPDSKISCVIADVAVGWILETATELGAEPLLFMPASAAPLALITHIPDLLEQGFLRPDGSVKGDSIIISDDIPVWGKDELPWCIPNSTEAQKLFFESWKELENPTTKWILTNNFYDVESSACNFIPNLLPIGPLLEDNASKSSVNSYNFHADDVSCLSWLDSKPPGSVVYVSFGSSAVFSQQQLDELAVGLEMSGRAFLWVVRPDIANGKRAEFSDGFAERVGELGKIVEWAPQEKVLSHRSVACFLSHCGWNSTLEGLSNGVPFLCWPYFGDQFHNQNYICDKWEIGLRIDPDENGIRLGHEIKNKVDMLFGNDNLKGNALKLKEMSAASVNEGGDSYKNFHKFIDHLRNNVDR
ncbi:hypothetical protein C2S53_013826 [Perilla frutescens var. hirtella]|uniref:Glycosyltransferase N-terminal domain-containing protein n=1 Tax=Perilla frutescens var. hirtella TaxID=608512 RepID=A0AAD4J726_PERFH|nr:hypothetical protein C2S53_013826 [Perilla frutescens var. hirtella]